jgi:acyl-CoA synthetase (AMP-forming)/AMP-acid ligase II
MIELPDGAPRTFGELVSRRAADPRPAFVSVAGGEVVGQLSFADVAQRSWGFAAQLAELELTAEEDEGGPQPAVLISCAEPLFFIGAFFGALMAGIRPVPIPAAISQHPRHAERVRAVAAASHPAAALTSDETEPVLRELLRESHVAIHSFAQAPRASTAPTDRVGAMEGGAYIQYTSGSVTAPKPIAVTADHAIAHLAQAARMYEETLDSASVNWVPLYHDMGLVTSVLRPLYSGYTSVLMRPQEFVADPGGWLSAMTSWRATHTSAPDFGYSLCAEKAQSRAEWNLSSLRVARVAGEMVRHSTLMRFEQRFRNTGFRMSAFAPSYGLAEATLTVTSCAVADTPRVLWADRAALSAGTVNDMGTKLPDATAIVSCGKPLPATTVRIVDESGRDRRVDGEVGEVWIAGPQVILDQPPDILEGVAGRRTGDLGFIIDGELYLLGRAHERFQINGENYYCADVEGEIFAASPLIRAGRAVVAATPAGSAVAVNAEWSSVQEPQEDLMRQVARAITAGVSRRFGISVDSVTLLRAGSLPLTTSGKLRRHDIALLDPQACLRTFRRGERFT